MYIWMCEDLGDDEQSGFGRTKKAAELYVANNRGFRTPKECRDNGWSKPAVKVDRLPPAIVKALLAH